MTPPYPDLQTYFQRNLHVYLDLLHQMVVLNSFTLNASGVNAVGQLTAEIFAPLGFEAEFIPPADFRHGRHLVLTRVGRADRGEPAPAIDLISHLDTVFPAAEEQINDFHFRIEGDRIYGPGGGDKAMLKQLVNRLRRKIEPEDGDSQAVIEAVPGVGYALVEKK